MKNVLCLIIFFEEFLFGQSKITSEIYFKTKNILCNNVEKSKFPIKNQWMVEMHRKSHQLRWFWWKRYSMFTFHSEIVHLIPLQQSSYKRKLPLFTESQHGLLCSFPLFETIFDVITVVFVHLYSFLMSSHIRRKFDV